MKKGGEWAEEEEEEDEGGEQMEEEEEEEEDGERKNCFALDPRIVQSVERTTIIYKRLNFSPNWSPGGTFFIFLDMNLPEIADFARNFAVMVRVQGPDPKGLKMRKHAFHHYHSGKTTLSASGMLVPDSLCNMKIYYNNDQSPTPSSAFVVTVASVIEPFLTLQHRENISQVLPELIPGAQIDIMVEDKIRMEYASKEMDERTPHWIPAQLLAMVDVSVSSIALQSLIDASSGSSEHGWEVGWSLASYSNEAQPYLDSIKTEVGHDIELSRESWRPLDAGESGHPSILGSSTTRVALLRLSSICKELPNMVISSSNKRGDLLLAMGSPFGVLSPGHFFNSISVGSISNYHPSSSSSRSLLMADIRCLPGMEGGPVLGDHAHVIGILTRPLRQKSSGAEVQLVIPWEAIAIASTDLLKKECQNAGKRINTGSGNVNAVGMTCLSNSCGSDGTSNNNLSHPVSGCLSLSLIEKAMTSICLVTVDGGIWASGVLLNNKGLILTNAHLLEPWRFGRSTVNYGKNGNDSQMLFLQPKESVSPMEEGVGNQQMSWGLLPESQKIVSSVDDKSGKYNFRSTYSGLRRIRVRLDHVDPWIWCDASVVYISKGPLDIALLQLDFVPDQLCPIIMDFAYPSPGLKAYVIGHGLFGPQSDIFPSICPGVVAKVVKAKMPLSYKSDCQKHTFGDIPVMVETTAAVHPGGSGGAVVNSDSHMIGLVTSNARHGGGMVIPHLNFSIPCAALEPIFKFSKDMQDLSLLHDLDKPNEHLSSVWALMPSLSQKPDPSLPNIPHSLLEDGNKQGKGSRFAKFVAEKNEIFKKATQVGKVERFSSDGISSKL
ncbi:glyoxysomal processing protease, glyoxysomal [Malania oleifera]|uniref:glyoxysomal processing protease, glyoxysomal n=1 Tax=Malania oleifera TaxID=397392 RepID=UPI0025ADB35A|nr:glyoxysomal processing protease, glyoxysomal [Malania oleifera]